MQNLLSPELPGYAAWFNPLPCPVLVTDTYGYIQTTNADLLAVVGGTEAQWRYQPMEKLLPPASRIFLQTHVWPMVLAQGGVREIYLHLCDAQGQRIPVMVNCQRGLNDSGGQGNSAGHFYWVFFVALERSRFEAELLQARARAQSLAAKLSVANAELRAVHAQLTQHTHVVESENRELAELSKTDPLTGLGNRRALAQAVAQWQALAEPGGCASLLMVDVDHFKAINDQHGHAEGDRVLTALAQQLQMSIRSTDLAVRWGGEEFTLWLPNADRPGAAHTALRVHENVRNLQVGGQPITVSIGVATATQIHDPSLVQRLVHRSDTALYQAKVTGRNRTVFAE
jgi:sigma-B regulation protein RsbU (phosphoserine phosphatase)